MPRTWQPATILDKLEGGDRRSLGRSPEVVHEVLLDPSLVRVLFQGLRSADPIIRMRAADALEKVTSVRPEWLKPRKRDLLLLARQTTQQELRWHLAQMLPRLSLSRPERRVLVSILREYLQDRSSIVKTCALQALADLAVIDPTFRVEAKRIIEAAMPDGTPAMRARGRRLLARWPTATGHSVSIARARGLPCA
jgi:hypothetical protein